MSAHVLLNLLNELRKRDKMRGLSSILSLFRNEFNKFNNTGAQMLNSIDHMTSKLFEIIFLGVKTLGICLMRDVKSVISYRSPKFYNSLVFFYFNAFRVISLPDATSL